MKRVATLVTAVTLLFNQSNKLKFILGHPTNSRTDSIKQHLSLKGGWRNGDYNDAPGPDFDNIDKYHEKKQASLTEDEIIANIEVYENILSKTSSNANDTHIHRWTYSDGTDAAQPIEVQPPDLWQWSNEWCVDYKSNPNCDASGWYDVQNNVHNDSSDGDYLRRRRWIRTMRLKMESAKPEQLIFHEAFEPQSVPDLLLENGTIFENNDYLIQKQRDLFIFQLHRNIYSSLKLVRSNVVRWWDREFAFRGFGIGLVNPIYRGGLIRPNFADTGLGLRIPITANFHSWEECRDLPMMSASVFLFWPLKLQSSFTLSYASTQMQSWLWSSKTNVLKLAGRLSFYGQKSRRKNSTLPAEIDSKSKFAPRGNKVVRIGITFNLRFSHDYGVQVWLSPYIFLLPGIKIIGTILSAVLHVLSIGQDEFLSMTPMYNRILNNDMYSPLAYLLMLWFQFKNWADKKTSGLGYSVSYSRAMLRGSVLVNFQPFFFPSLSRRHQRKMPSKAISATSIPELIDVPDYAQISNGNEFEDREKEVVFEDENISLGKEDNFKLESQLFGCA